jgi:hypothetical protein
VVSDEEQISHRCCVCLMCANPTFQTPFGGCIGAVPTIVEKRAPEVCENLS